MKFPLLDVLKLEGFIAKAPLNIAGTLREPPTSLPFERGTHLAPTKAPSPPELPPQVLSLFQGFSAIPKVGLSVCKPRRPY